MDKTHNFVHAKYFRYSYDEYIFEVKLQFDIQNSGCKIFSILECIRSTECDCIDAKDRVYKLTPCFVNFILCRFLRYNLI